MHNDFLIEGVYTLTFHLVHKFLKAVAIVDNIHLETNIHVAKCILLLTSSSRMVV